MATLKKAEHQAARVARIFGASLGAQLVAYDIIGQATDRKTITALAVSAVIAALEATYRQVFPTVPISRYLTPADEKVLQEKGTQLVESVLRVPSAAAAPVPLGDAITRVDDHGQRV